MGLGPSKKEEEFVAKDAAKALADKQFYRRNTFALKHDTDVRVKVRNAREANEMRALVEVPTVGSWTKPNKELAKVYQSEHHPRIAGPDGTWLKFPLRTKVMRLGSEFGPGIALYFRFLIFIGVSFFIFAACASPWVGINQVAVYRFPDANGTKIPIEQTKTFAVTGARLDGLSLGGVLEVPGYSKEDQAAFLVDAQVAGHRLLVSREKYTALIQLMDIFGTLCFIAGIIIFFKWLVPKVRPRARK